MVCFGQYTPARAADPAVKACRMSCKRIAAACIRKVKDERRVRATACASTSDRRACMTAVRSTQRTGKQRCRTARTVCRTCCTTGGGPCVGEEPVFDGTFPMPDRDVLATLPLPPGPSGIGVSWLVTADGALVIDPSRRSSVSAAAECATLVLACFRPGLRNWAGCFDAAPPCPSDTPWLEDGDVCCPGACAARYQELRQAGLDGPAAVTRAIWDAPSCIPGLVGRAPEEQP
jgi:hypothetical protein